MNTKPGIRPHLQEVCEDGKGNTRGVVYSAEYGGGTTYLTVTPGEKVVMVLASAQQSFELDNRVDLKGRPDDCMFFSSDGVRLRPDPGLQGEQ